jgi:hypothetical protein
MLAGFAYKGSRLSSVVRSERTASEGDALKEFTGTEIKEEALSSIGDLKAGKKKRSGGSRGPLQRRHQS